MHKWSRGGRQKKRAGNVKKMDCEEAKRGKEGSCSSFLQWVMWNSSIKQSERIEQKGGSRGQQPFGVTCREVGWTERENGWLEGTARVGLRSGVGSIWNRVLKVRSPWASTDSAGSHTVVLLSFMSQNDSLERPETVSQPMYDLPRWKPCSSAPLLPPSFPLL